MITRSLRRLSQHFLNDSLFRNSVYLMLSTALMAGFGFFFWIIIARLFTTEQIGLATTMISAVGLIASLSLLGLDVGIIRYLSRSEKKNDHINTGFFAATLAALTILTIFLVGLKTFSPRLLFIRENPYYILLFIFFVVIFTSNSLLESIFIALRNTKFILIKNTIYSALRLLSPLFLVGLGVYGIFGSYMAALALGFLIGFIILIKKFDYAPQLIIHKSTIEKIGRYSFGNYIANLFGILPIMALPLMITNALNPETTAYYYMAMAIASLLFIIPGATTQSLFAEGSHNEQELKQHVRKAINIIAVILIPAILITVFFGGYILLVFGKNYSTEGFRFLQVLALSGIFISINSVFGTILKVKRRIKQIIFINILGALSILGLSYLLMSKGLLGIGFAWILGQGIMSLIYSLL